MWDKRNEYVAGENGLLGKLHSAELLWDFSCTHTQKLRIPYVDAVGLCLRETYIGGNLAQIPKQMGKWEEQISLHSCATQVSSNSTSVKWKLDSLAWFYTQIPRRHVAFVNWSPIYSEAVLPGSEQFVTERGFVKTLTSFCQVRFVPAVVVHTQFKALNATSSWSGWRWELTVTAGSAMENVL